MNARARQLLDELLQLSVEDRALIAVEPDALAELAAGVDWYEQEASGTGVALAVEAEARVNALGEESHRRAREWTKG